MAGIEEVSAIITVAELGLRLSGYLIDYITEVKEASQGIHSLGNEIKTTCERLQDIAGIVQKNRRFHILSHAGFQSAVRASDECKLAIGDIRYTLRNTEYQYQPDNDVDRDKIDFSLLTRLQWPIVKRKLEAPKAELRRIRADLTLTFTAAMVMLASNQEERATYYRKLPKLEKEKNRRAQAAKYIKQRDKTSVNQGLTDDSSSDSQCSQSSEPDHEGIALDPDFLQFKQEKKSESRKKRMHEELVKLQAKQEVEEAQAQEARRKIEEEAVEKYKESLKRQKQAIASRTASAKVFLREELARQCLPPNQIQSILDNCRFDSNDSDAVMDFQVPQTNQVVTEGNGSAGDLNGVLGSKAGNRNSRLQNFWRNLKDRSKPKSQDANNKPSHETIPSVGTWSEYYVVETWVLDLETLGWTLYGNQPVKVGDKEFKRKSRDVWQHYSQIPSLPREALGAFYQWKIRDAPGKWNIFTIDLMKATTRTGIFGRVEEIIGLRVKIARREVAYESNPYWSASKYDAGAPNVGYARVEGHHPGLEYTSSQKAKEAAMDIPSGPNLKSAHFGPSSAPYRKHHRAKDNQEAKIPRTAPTAQNSGPPFYPELDRDELERNELERNVLDNIYYPRYDQREHEYRGRSPRRRPQFDKYQKSHNHRGNSRELPVYIGGTHTVAPPPLHPHSPSAKGPRGGAPNDSRTTARKYDDARSTARARSYSRTRPQHTFRDPRDRGFHDEEAYDDDYIRPVVPASPKRLLELPSTEPAKRHSFLHSGRAGNEDKTISRALVSSDETREMRSRDRASAAAPVRSLIKATPAPRRSTGHAPSPISKVSPSVPRRSDNDVILSILNKYTSFKGDQLPIHISRPLALAAPTTLPQTSAAEENPSTTTAPLTREPASAAAVSPRLAIFDSPSRPKDAIPARRPTVESVHSDDDLVALDRSQRRGEGSPVSPHSPSSPLESMKLGTVRFESPRRYDSTELETDLERDDGNEDRYRREGLEYRSSGGPIVVDVQSGGPKNGEFEGGKDGEDETDSSGDLD